MIQFFATVLFMLLAFGIMAAALHFSQYKKKEESCCGNGHCSTGHNHVHEHHNNNECKGHCGTNEDGCATGTCYSSKAEFVDNFEKLKIKKINI